MLRLLARTVLHLLANAVGLLIAAAFLPGFNIDVLSFAVVTAIFTVIEVIAGPLLVSLSVKYAPALVGGIALITTFAGLLVANVASDGLNIDGIGTWLMASLIVWAGALIAGFVLPLFLFKQLLSGSGSRDSHRGD